MGVESRHGPMADSADRWHRLETVVHAALERPADERAAFLAEACGDDEALRQEAASLVERDARADGFLAAPLGALAANVVYSPGGTVQPDASPDLIGRRIGHYEMRARVGAGGMGVVYRAHDHALGRSVAIKVLPEAFASDRDRLARFEREARLLASLDHPNIAAIYGLEKSGDVSALVLEFIEGETLEVRLTRGPLAAAQALALAVQIADALDHAHKRGVTHRDLKPSNIMLTRTGAKLLDFGLAKWTEGSRGYVPSSSADRRVRPDGAGSLTEEGMILGTLHYMAPEQHEGKAVDARADVFAFGAVLYEMLTGRKAFDGGSAPAVMAAVLNAEPAALDTIHQLTSPSLERLVRKCLAKDPDDRWQTTRDLADELKWIAHEADRPAIRSLDRSGGDPSLPGTFRGRTLGLAYVAGVVAVTSALTGWAGWRLAPMRDSAARVITRFEVEPAAPIDLFDISPDGTEMVYSAGPMGRLIIRRFDQFGDSPIPGTDGADAPVFSPDGQWIAFFSGKRMLKVNVRTRAAPILLADNIDRWLSGATWLADDTIVFSRPNHGLQRVSAEGGEPVAVTSLSQTPREFDHHSPTLLPGGQALLFTVHESDGRFNVVVEMLATAERKLVIESAYDARYVATGHLVFARNSTILAVPFDLRRLQVTGPPLTLVERVADRPRDGDGGYRLSTSGTLVYQSKPSVDGRTLTWVDPAGAETLLPISPRAFSSPSVSPDGGRLAFAVEDGGRCDIFTFELASGALARLTRDGDNRTPIWTRDGQRLTYSSSLITSTSTTSTRTDARLLVTQPADRSGGPEPLVSGGISLVPGSWSADGRVLVYTDGGTDPKGLHMLALHRDGEGKPQPLFDGPAEEGQPSLSPDGRWLAFMANETARAEIYVSAFPTSASLYQVSVEGGRQPKWSRDGRELVYRSGRRMLAVTVKTASAFSAGKPRVLFEGDYVSSGLLGLDYDLAPDGRFLMVKPSADEQTPARVRVVVNWIDEVKQRVPGGK
jgi:serine/threonine protein kinase/Tol biopolymer transport system component